MILVLAEGLGDLGVLDDVEDGLSLLLEAFIGVHGVLTLAGELCERYE